MAGKDAIRVFDMFCGGGGSSRGAWMAGAVPAGCGLDMWELAAKTYQLNFPSAVTYHIKAGKLPAQRVLKEAGPIRPASRLAESVRATALPKGKLVGARKAGKPPLR